MLCKRGNYTFSFIQNVLNKRRKAFNHKKFVKALSTVINQTESSGYFRLFDSGDLQSVQMLRKICLVAKSCPNIKFWLPSKEVNIIKSYLKKYKSFPKNLTVRISSYMIEQEPLTIAKTLGLVTSTVSRDNNKVNCLAEKQGHKCLLCRACWDGNISNICYKKH